MYPIVNTRVPMLLQEIISLCPHPGCIPWSEIITKPDGGTFVDKSALQPIALDNETAVVLQSSGTTGFPKAVELTHRNWVLSLVMRA